VPSVPIRARELEHDLSSAFHDRVIVTRKLIVELDQKHAWNATIDFKCWHPEADE
jgi:hypothetical protein